MQSSSVLVWQHMTRRVTHVRYLGKNIHPYGNENCLVEIFEDGFKIQMPDGRWSALVTWKEFKTIEVWQKNLKRYGQEWELVYGDVGELLKEAEDLLKEMKPWL